MLPPILETSRLILRAPRYSDLDRWATFMEDPEATRFLGGPQPRSVAWTTMAMIAGNWSVHGFSLFSIIERRTDRWIGRVGPWLARGLTTPEVGWALARDSWGHGYALEAATAAIDWAINTGLIGHIISHAIDPEDKPSIALAKRLGAGHRGLGPRSPYGRHRLGLWEQTVDQWRARYTVNRPLNPTSSSGLRELSRRREPPGRPFD